jgi:cell wall-associated NlpC family hydrolase
VLISEPKPSSAAQLYAQATAVKAQIARLDHRLAADVEKYDQARAELDAINVALATARMQLQAAQNQLATQQAILADRLSSMYKAGPFTLLDVLLESRDFADIEAEANLFRLIGEQDAATEQSVARLVDSAATLEHDIDVRHAAALQVATRIDGQRMIIADELAQRQAVLDDLDRQMKQILARQQASARSTSERLARLAGVDIGSIRGTPAQIAVVRETMRWLGVPYVWAGASPSQGFDCSGLVMYVYAKFGVRLPHAATLQARLGRPVSFDDLQPADLVFFGSPSFYYHVGIYIGDGLFIEAPHTGDVVKVSRLAGRGCALACRYDLRLP